MSPVKQFGTTQQHIQSYADFWNWFQENERGFFNAIKDNNDLEKEFVDKLSPRLQDVKDGLAYHIGMLDANTAELVLSPDGDINNIVFVEELVNAAPVIPGWSFTCFKPPSDIKHARIDMEGYTFDKDTLSFYQDDLEDYPDRIDITFVHKNYNEVDQDSIIHGTYIFLTNFIGELNSLTAFDRVKIIGRQQAEKELIPIEKLMAFLLWRQKEFVEKYEGTIQNTDTAEYSNLEAELESGNKLIATINTDILTWDKKASHPWIARLEIRYDGQSTDGMPDNTTLQLLTEIEEKAIHQLKDFDGYINIGRQTSDNLREVYFACKDFRKPSKVFHQLTKEYQTLDIKFEIYKDKYWKSFNMFTNVD